MAGLLSCLKNCARHRDIEIVAFFKRISDECMIARPDRAILQLLPGSKV